MSSMINRLRTLWIGGDSMAGFKLLKTLSLTSKSDVTTDVGDSITEVIVIVYDSKYTQSWTDAIVFGAVLDVNTSGQNYTSRMNGFYGVKLGNHVYASMNYGNADVAGSGIGDYTSNLCGIRTGSSVYNTTKMYIYGR